MNMKMENQYKSEAELYVLANILEKAEGKHSESLLLHLSPIGWDHEVLIKYLLELSKKFGFGLKNLTCCIDSWDDILPRVYEKLQRAIKDNPQSEYARRQKRFLENKFSVADIEKELSSIIFDDTLDTILGDGQSLFETIAFDLNINEKSKNKIRNYLSEYLKKFINDDLVVMSEEADINEKLTKNIIGSPKNVYTLERHRNIIFEVLDELRKNHGGKFLIKETQIPKAGANFLFMHTILALEQLGYLIITLLGAHDAEEAKMARYRTKDGEPIIKDVSSYEAWVRLTPKFLKEIEAKNKDTGKKESETITLYLNSVGDLWREPKDKFCYPVGETSDRHKIVRYLVTNKGYQQTTQISLALGEKSKQTIRQEKRKINENFRKRLKIKTDDLIKGRQGSGYRINPGYKISLKDG